MKKKLLFMLINMNVGGTEKALLNMISEIPKDRYDVTILMLEEYGGFLGSIPETVKIEYLKDFKYIKALVNQPPLDIALSFLLKRKIVQAVEIAFFHLLSKVKQDRGVFLKYILKNYPTMNDTYDVAVAYAGPMDFISFFVLDKIKAKKKIQWIHFDITKIGFDHHFSSKMYNKFDKVFAVSEEAKNKLVSVLPSLKEKSEVFYNIVSSHIIQKQTQIGKSFNDGFDGIRILTVGRLAYEKGQEFAIRVLTRLVKDGYKVKWYCVGEGSSRKEYVKLSEILGVNDKFIFLGADPNPYNYIAQCDIYVQPSRYEGYCLTIIEAKCLNKPIVTTNVNGSNEQIRDGETGLIVNIDEDEIYVAVKKLIDNKALCNTFSNNLAVEKYDGTLEMNKLYSVCN